MAKLSNLSINIPLLEEIQEIPRYAQLMKKLMSKNNLIYGDTIEVTHGFSAIMSSKITVRKEDLEAFTIPCSIGIHMFEKALCDLDGSINLMTFFIYTKLGLETLIPTSMRLLMVDRSIKRPMDFVVLDCEMDQEVLIILSEPFLATGRAIVNLELREMRFRVHEDEVSFQVCKTRKQPATLQVISMVDVETKEVNKRALDDLT
ncbi:uncharacterized protein LOC124888899 [Capsicum annuum]|uniref:uncharacterized protein LOC124888899 n=1 Tax=Capsicum annuum TaxID=4072 RepID=UPI001FB14218|nr:uncharacterized protein LOC124888899 [Capsicum annuum]